MAGNFPRYREWDAGRLFFLHGVGSWQSWAVMYYTSSIWSHVGSFTEDGRIIHATTGGVIEHDFSDLFDGRSYIMINVFSEMPSAEIKAEITSTMRSQLGSGFNWAGVFRFWLAIVTGAHADYRLKHSLDLGVLAGCFASLGFLFPAISYFSLTGYAIYGTLVLINIPRRQAMRAILRGQTKIP